MVIATARGQLRRHLSEERNPIEATTIVLTAMTIGATTDENHAGHALCDSALYLPRLPSID